MKIHLKKLFPWFNVIVLMFLNGCITQEAKKKEVVTPTESKPTEAGQSSCVPASTHSKWDLWKNGVCLRGANLWQKRIESEFDGDSFGTEKVGPPYQPAELKALRDMGANYVNLSVPGPFSEAAPYKWDDMVWSHLENLLDRVKSADLFAVICFRTGPGRNEAGFDESEKKRANHRVWKDKAAQTAWVEMWKEVAKRLKSRREVVGYDLMVEPNADQVVVKTESAQQFYGVHRNSLLDWNPFAESIAKAIRSVDSDTPILVGAMSYSHVDWLGQTELKGIDKVVYTAHFYEPYEYTHQKPDEKIGFPGKLPADLSAKLKPIEELKKSKRLSVAVNEFGVVRWAPGATNYLETLLNEFERLEVNHALWLWESAYKGVDYDHFNFRHGTDAGHKKDVAGKNPLAEVLSKGWAKNRVFPSKVTSW